MERKEEFVGVNRSFLGKKTKKNHKSEEIYISDEADISTALMDTTTELSFENLISLEEKSELKGKIPGFDDLKIPAFFNDFKINKDVNNAIKKYNKIKRELGSPELAKLYLIDKNRIYGDKKKYL